MPPALTRLYDALDRGDLPGAGAALTEDSVLVVPGRGVNAGTYAGRGAILDFVATASRVTAGTLRMTVHRVLDDGEWAVAVVAYTATRPDGRTALRNDLAHVARLRDGLVAQSWLHSRNQYEVDEFWGLR